MNTPPPADEMREACLAYLVDPPARETVLALRERLAAVRPNLPPHLQLPPHVTVKFLGRRSPAVVNELHRRFQALPICTLELACHAAEVFELGGEKFNIHLAIAVGGPLAGLQAAAERVLRQVGCPDNDRYRGPRYRPHITVVDYAGHPTIEELRLLESALPLRISLRTLVQFEKPAGRPVLPQTRTVSCA
jgi:2'-5' RNA ligase